MLNTFNRLAPENPHGPALHVITAVRSPLALGRLLRLLSSLEAVTRDCVLTWWLVYDLTACAPGDFNATLKGVKIQQGGALDRHAQSIAVQWNWALERIADGWCYFLSDDTLMHPFFSRALSNAAAQHPEKRAFTFHQSLGAGSFRFSVPDSVEGLDIGQVVLDRAWIGAERFPLDGEPGLLVDTLHAQDPDAFGWIDGIMSFYQRLNWQ